MPIIRLASAAFAAVVLAASSSAQTYKAEVFIPGSGMHGIHGIAFDAEDRMFVGSVVGQAIYEINSETGQHRTYVGPPNGMADDLEFSEDGTLFWTSFALGKVHAQKNFGPTREVANSLPGINSLAFNAEGRLFATQVFLGDALYEIDPVGLEAPRKIMENMGGLNGFDFGPDGFLYGPLWFKGAIAKIDVDAGTLEVIMEGFKIPAAVNFDSKGNLWVVDSAAGQIVKVDVNAKTRVVYPGMPTAIDNLDLDGKDQLWFTVMAENAVYRFDEPTGEAILIRRDEFAQPCDLHIYREADRELLYVADNFAVKVVDLATKEVTSIARNVESSIQYPNGIFVNEKHIVLSSWFSNTVQVLDRITGEEIHTYEAVVLSMDSAELDDGRLAVLNQNVQVSEASDQPPSVWTNLATAPGRLTSLAYAGDLTAYASAPDKGVVYQLELNQKPRRMLVGGLSEPEGIALTPDGAALIVVEIGKQAVTRVDLTSGEVTTLAADIPVGWKMPEFLPPSGPLSGVAVASDGAIYVTSDVEGAIYKLTPTQAPAATE